MSLAGAIILILAMATALTNYVIDAGIPHDILDWFVEKGMREAWHFIIVLNIFLFILGMLMDAFSALLVALPLLIPLAANFHLNPFYLAVMFLLNLEIAYVTPPVGLNLYISSFRFRRPVVQIYRVVLPFVGLLAAGLVLVILWPRLSDFTVQSEIERVRDEAAERGVPPRDAWVLECVQEDRLNLIPCSDEDIAKWGKDGRGKPDEPAPEATAKPDEAKPDAGEADDGTFDEDELLREIMGEGGGPAKPKPDDTSMDEDDMMREIMGEE